MNLIPKSNVFFLLQQHKHSKKCSEKQIKRKSQFCEICIHICKTHLND